MKKYSYFLNLNINVSHDLIVKNNYLRNLTVNSKFNPISIKENMFIKLKIYFKKIKKY